MESSFVLARSGATDHKTGLFVLEGSCEDVLLPPETVSVVGRSRSHYEIQSGAPFREDKDSDEAPEFINKQTGYNRDLSSMGVVLHNITKGDKSAMDKVDERDHGVYGQSKITKLSDTQYVTEWVGLSPPGRAIKVIVRELNVAKSRVALFATGVPPSMGGQTWVMSPGGFTWVTSEQYAVLDGTRIDLEQIGNSKDLFLAVTNAVAFIGGHRNRARDEKTPRFLHYDFEGLPRLEYQAVVTNYFSDIANGYGGDPLSVGMTQIQALMGAARHSGRKAGKPRSSALFGIADEVISFETDVDEDMFCLRRSHVLY